MNGPRSIKRNEANYPVAKSIRLRSEATSPTADEWGEEDRDDDGR